MTGPALARVASLMFVAMTCIVIGDTASKKLSEFGVSPLFVAWTRFAVAAIVLAPFCAIQRSDAAAFRDYRLWLRAFLVMAGICCILTALRSEPIANVFGAFFIGPVVAFVLAAVILKEPVTPARSLLLAVGFAGVCLVVRPGFGLSVGIGFALLAGLFYSGYLVSTRAIAPLYRPRLLLISQLAIGAVFLAPLGLPVWPSDPTLPIWGLVLLSALASAAGNLLLVLLSKTTPSAVLSPLVYLQLISATVLGYLVFGDFPDTLSFIGLAIILFSGLAGLALVRR